MRHGFDSQRDGASIQLPHRVPRGGDGFRFNSALAFDSEDAFAAALLEDVPPAPDRQAEILATNRAGLPLIATP
jgi:hypothetical protein